MEQRKSFFAHYAYSVSLIVSVAAGCLVGIVWGQKAVMFKPLGEMFLNMLFTVVVPLVFFSISSAVAGMAHTRRLIKILGAMMTVFVVTGMIASLVMVAGVMVYPPAQGMTAVFSQNVSVEPVHLSQKIVEALTVSDFAQIFSRANMLAMILLAMFMGLAAGSIGDKGRAFVQFLKSGNEVMMRLVSYVLYCAPVGLGAYFAYLTGVFGPELLGAYARAMALFYALSVVYYFTAFSFYARWAGGPKAVGAFWSNIMPTSLMALATGSSVAVISSNLEAARKAGVPEDIRDVVIPIGSTIHMDGSCLSAVLKIAVLFGVYQMDFTGAATLLTAVGVALLSGTVMSGIPGGGFVGEMLIVSLYGFPPEGLAIISMIGTLVDPPATMVNAVGDNVASMMVARLLGGKQWMRAS